MTSTILRLTAGELLPGDAIVYDAGIDDGGLVAVIGVDPYGKDGKYRLVTENFEGEQFIDRVDADHVFYTHRVEFADTRA